eukprot:TRINITY_DN29299_c0_g1_i1.p1 TRINITY_DN29299_c0_g1~~TRINITY_DN29299_c0_g1_i1.p1  ORF type:complete len:360 (+),score=61.22 TRINITY_DN29299_c0_g1_i1:69-1082(+)
MRAQPTLGRDQVHGQRAEQDRLKGQILSRTQGEAPAALHTRSSSSLRTNDALVHSRASLRSVHSEASEARSGSNTPRGVAAQHARAGLAGKSSSILPEDSPKDLSVGHIFAPLFTFASLILFISPIWQIVHLAGDDDVTYWMGSQFGIVAALLPSVLIGSFLVHKRLQQPDRLVMLFSLLVPSIALFATSYIITQQAAEISSGLGSSSCERVGRSLQESWQMAKALQESCSGEAAAKQGIQWCSQYEALYEMQAEAWDYLQLVEERHSCAGWCRSSLPLWRLPERVGEDSCSTAVSQSLARKAARTAGQVQLYCLFIIVATSMAAVAMAMVSPMSVL